MGDVRAPNWEAFILSLSLSPAIESSSDEFSQSFGLALFSNLLIT
jgi:hypothetical protein